MFGVGENEVFLGYGEERASICSDLLSSVNLSGESEVLSQNLSGGMKRRLSLACAFVGSTKLVLLGPILSPVDLQSLFLVSR